MEKRTKIIVLAILSVGIIILLALGLTANPTTNVEYLRIHIRANSNSEIDQQVKYQVKDKIVNFLTPYLAECDTKQKAEQTILRLEKEIEKIADDVLDRNGFSYSSDALIKTEKFPLRTYSDLTLESGYYDALIVNLGSGEGDNWWCVVYPPLCFIGEGTNYVYKSKILEIIDKFKNKGGIINEKNS